MTTDLSKRPELQAFFARGYWQCLCGGYQLRKPDLAECPICHATRPTAPRQAGSAPVIPHAQNPPQAAKGKAGGPNKTELEARGLFPGRFLFEGRTFSICGGATYTPDWVDQETAVAIETKGEFIHSRDSRRRFDEAKHLFPQWSWIWARKRSKGRKGPRWEIEIYEKQH